MTARRRGDPTTQRRLLLVALGAAISGSPALLRAQASGGGMRRVGLLSAGTRANDDATHQPFFDQMRQLGWIEGQNIRYDRVYAEDRHQDLPRLTAELVLRQPGLIYATSTPAALAARHATRTIPIVFRNVGNPVGIGLVNSLARPGGNLTGISGISGALLPKRIEMLREILPGAKRFGVLVEPDDSMTRLIKGEFAPVAASLGLTIIIAEATKPADFDAAVAHLIAQRVDAIFGVSVLANSMRVRLIELANQKRLPVVGGLAWMAEAGGIFSYGALLADQMWRAAFVIDKILKGAKPADIPVEQPTVFELVVNLKAAKALGITIPQSILLRADRVIE